MASSSVTRPTLPAPMVITASPERDSRSMNSMPPCKVLEKTTFLWPAALMASDRRSPGDAFDGSLARGVYVRDHDDVRLIKRALKIFPETLRARVAVRLEKHQQSLVSQPRAASSVARISAG